LRKRRRSRCGTKITTPSPIGMAMTKGGLEGASRRKVVLDAYRHTQGRGDRQRRMNFQGEKRRTRDSIEAKERLARLLKIPYHKARGSMKGNGVYLVHRSGKRKSVAVGVKGEGPQGYYTTVDLERSGV